MLCGVAHSQQTLGRLPVGCSYCHTCRTLPCMASSRKGPQKPKPALRGSGLRVAHAKPMTGNRVV